MLFVYRTYPHSFVIIYIYIYTRRLHVEYRRKKKKNAHAIYAETCTNIYEYIIRLVYTYSGVISYASCNVFIYSYMIHSRCVVMIVDIRARVRRNKLRKFFYFVLAATKTHSARETERYSNKHYAFHTL